MRPLGRLASFISSLLRDTDAQVIPEDRVASPAAKLFTIGCVASRTASGGSFRYGDAIGRMNPMASDHIKPDEASRFKSAEGARVSAESARAEAEQFRRLAEETRAARDQHREALE